MIDEYARLLKARNWMKKNTSFLYSWHAYVGYELDLFEKFKKPSPVQQVADEYGYQAELLSQWVEVGLAVKHLKPASGGRVRTARKFRIPDSKSNPRSTGVILKEMMELHIPTLLTYPKLMESNEKNMFDNDVHGQTVAQTSSLLEQLAFPKFQKLMRKHKFTSVLDIGCGHAGYLSRLARQYPKVRMMGIELNGEVAKAARQRCSSQDNIRIEQADLTEYKPDKPADFIMMNNLLHYIAPEERSGTLRQVAQWLTKKGKIAIMTPIGGDEKGAQFSSAFNSFFTAFKNLYPVPSEADMKKIARSAGLKIGSFKPIIKEGGWYLVTLERR